MKLLAILAVLSLAAWPQAPGARMRLGTGVGAAVNIAPVLVSNYSTGTDNGFLQESLTALSAPSLFLFPKTPNNGFVGGSHNCAVMAVSSAVGLTQNTPTDTAGDTWVAGPSIATTGVAGVTWKTWYSLGISSASSNKITITTSGASTGGSIQTSLGAILTEVYNCNTSTVGGNGTLNTAATGSALTLTLNTAPASGDMVWAAFIDSSVAGTGTPITNLTTISPGTGFTAITRSKTFGKLAEYNTATTSTSVQATYSGTDNVLGVALVIKQGPAGTAPPATKYIDNYQVEQIPATTTPTLDFPFGGNLIVGLSGGGVGISSITGSTCTWNTGVSNSTHGVAQIVYGSNCTPSSAATVSPTYSGTPSAPGQSLSLVSITNANTSPFDTSTNTSGNQTTAANLTTSAITPTANGEIIFTTATITWHTETSLVADSNSHTTLPLFAVNTKADDAEPSCTTSTPNSTLDEDNPFGIYQNVSDHTAITFIWVGTQTTGTCTTLTSGVQGWSSVAAAFK